MSQENVEIVRRANEPLQGVDVAPFIRAGLAGNLDAIPPEVVAGADAVVATLREVTAPLLASLVGGHAYRPREIGPS